MNEPLISEIVEMAAAVFSEGILIVGWPDGAKIELSRPVYASASGFFTASTEEGKLAACCLGHYRKYQWQRRKTRNPTNLREECHDLYNRGFVAFGGVAGFGPTDVRPAHMNPQGIGGDLHNAMKLGLIPIEQLMPTAALLR